MKKERKAKEPYFKEAVSLWFDFYKSKFIIEPTFNTSEPRDLKLILESLRKRAEKKYVIWSLEEMNKRLIYFLNFAYSDNWLREHFTLRILNSQKDCIYVKLINSRLQKLASK